MIASTRFVLFRGAKRVLASFGLIASTRTAERFLMHFCEFYQKNSRKFACVMLVNNSPKMRELCNQKCTTNNAAVTIAAMVLAGFSGTKVNKLTTSNETCDSDLPSLMDEISSTNLEEFLTVYWVFPTKGTRICLRNLASW